MLGAGSGNMPPAKMFFDPNPLFSLITRSADNRANRYNFAMRSRTRRTVWLTALFSVACFATIATICVAAYFVYRWLGQYQKPWQEPESAIVQIGHDHYDPIPQDQGQLERLRRERIEYVRALYRESFDKLGKRDPRWDEPANQAVDAATRFFSGEPVPLTDVHAPAKTAVEVGCDDPLILHLYARSSYGTSYPSLNDADERWTQAMNAMLASAYPAEIRLSACVRAGEARLNIKEAGTKRRIEARDFFTKALAQMPEVMASDTRFAARNDWYDHLRTIRRRLVATGLSLPQAYQRIDDMFAEKPDRRAQRLIQQGCCLIDDAWESRGGAPAVAVTQKGFEGFAKSLVKARAVMEEAWTLDPADAKSATLMIQVEIGLGQGRQEMEKWFDRAMRADSDNELACRLKLDWLDPKWHGSLDDLVNFGRACRDTQNWSSGIPLLLTEAHYRVSRMTGRHYSKPAVADELMSMYEEYLRHKPDNNYVRCEFAGIANWCNRHDVAVREFKILGDQLVDTEWFPKGALEAVREESAEKAAKNRKN